MGAFITALPLLAQLLEKILPDKESADAAKLELMKLAQQGEQAVVEASVALASGQTETNRVEAASNRLFVAGWRPAVGWTCAIAVFFKFVGGPALFMIGQATGYPVELPEIETAELWPLLLGMLGLGGLRTVEKIKGAA